MGEVLKQLMVTLVDLLSKRKKIDEEFNEKIRKSKPVNVEFRKKQYKNAGEIEGTRNAIKLLKKQINNEYNSTNVDMVELHKLEKK